GLDWTGVAQIQIKAWDRTTGTAGDSADLTDSGGSTAYSVEVDAASIQVLAMNNAPVLDDAAVHTFTPMLEDNIDGLGNTVAEVVANGSISDLDGVAVESIAVTGADIAHGTWEYSYDHGSTWNDVGSVSESAALLLDSTYRL